MFGVTILGNNSALPAYDRHPTAQVVTLDQFQFLVDCGEGTQMQLARYKIRRSRINHIFISHLHGDHYFGLPGLITSMGLLGRDTDLHLYAPPELKPIIDLILSAADTKFGYTLHFHPLDKEGVLVDNAKFSVETFHVYHRIQCWGFIFREKKKPRKINKQAITPYHLNATQYESLKSGEDVTTDTGEVVLNETVTVANTPVRSYAYCADTLHNPTLADKVKHVTMVYHETTYLKGLEERASQRFHSTTHQAADIALKANAGRLLIGHFSSKYEELNDFLEEAREVFPTTDLAIEGVTYRIL
ncbi:ribonuclease Z [Segetibacter aerophilus]|uniref:Ribonuclease Z n=1 Tax=Segetibacter aerophilus TaxID=670293 RepID=A0A512BAM6_9BACT|nr:ribonuclease Z [Segetibacter aerophilus]GEO09021.1 ribonuclease Z [Segetibacter aerophilus]